MRQELINQIVRDVAELPDRTSPEDWPEAMLVTQDELAAILRTALSRPAPVAAVPDVTEMLSVLDDIASLDPHTNTVAVAKVIAEHYARRARQKLHAAALAAAPPAAMAGNGVPCVADLIRAQDASAQPAAMAGEAGKEGEQL